MYSESDAPAITAQSAALLSVLYTLCYVIPFYLSASTRPSPQLSRDAPSVVRARIRAVTLSCVLSALLTVYVAMDYGKSTLSNALRLMGWWPVAPLEIAKALLLTAVLFVGPLFESGIVEGGWRDWIRISTLTDTMGNWIGWRNYVAGPVSEELVFRSCLIPLHLLAKVSPGRIVFLTPLYFGIAHIHHFYEYKLTHPYTPLLPALLRSVVQFSYTSIFGFYATFLFLRTGSFPAVVVVHSFCNWCGLPRFWGRVEAGQPIGPPDIKGKDDGENVRTVLTGNLSGQGQLGLEWTIAYYLLLVAGAVGFYFLLWPLTSGERALAYFH
ncbi:hypothetical protein L228DRAFT_249099 [Xylona heveae TC161]|uniref:intramembrane prenyl-peptidase Rce1 n=1 Tax=Xylona heveae (strain CBS 132557 / TC161) TaxID=1328760 RepID=A0A165FRM9_XYLHT|nr:hypothetical protein L228DRAFT_249099 [Xylona heveae TC161]KZF21294.1 hypothetical protein L228DRAFT_249099 [Xylona heveae TC161]